MNDLSARASLRSQLRKLGVKTVTAEYDGEGDSGQVEDPDFGSVVVSGDLKNAALDLFYEVLEAYYAGWEINEGSFGEFVWNVMDDTIQLVHNTRLTEFETEKQTL